ncbi:MAG: tetratricopeptide repeat protein [Anaerolineales bacterium]|nr:tetratricopeptide repeat protein [Anaerolineales bacterium]
MTGEIKEQNNETIFQDALEALRRGDKPRAKELLTLLLKTDQNNATYWVWLSAAVDAQKERIYCLQTALKLDPENATAKRGLILLGALSPDDTIQPFPVNRPRAWEAKLLLATDKPKEKGFRAFTRSPIARLMGLVVITVGLCAAVIFGFILPRQSNVRPTETFTPGPSPTFTATPTLFGATARPTQAFSGPTPLEAYLPAPYTPTPLYVNTPRSLDSVDQFRIAQAAYEDGDWDTFLLNMELIRQAEPEAADVMYYIGEAYRFKGETTNALNAYNDALQLDPNFGPPYLGLARVRLLTNPRFNAEFLFEEAIDRDPFFGEVYLERARYYLNRGDYEDALADLETAEEFLPGSPEVYMTYARVYLAQEDTDKALEYAEKSYAADITSLPVYELLADLYIEKGDYQRALESLRVYTAFETEDASGFGKLGLVYFYLGEYEFTIDAIDRLTDLSRNGFREYYVYRGLSHLELGNADEAVSDLEVAVDEDDRSFMARLGLARAYYLDERFGTAFLQIDIAKSLTETEEEQALTLYWRARIQEMREEENDEIESWQALLELDEDVMTAEMREEAEARLRELVPATRTPTRGASTSTPRAGTPTPAAGTSPTVSRTPTRTPTATPTP